MPGFLGTGWGANVGEGAVLTCVNPGERDDLSSMCAAGNRLSMKTMILFSRAR
jgi:hypothetical protein